MTIRTSAGGRYSETSWLVHRHRQIQGRTSSLLCGGKKAVRLQQFTKASVHLCTFSGTCRDKGDFAGLTPPANVENAAYELFRKFLLPLL
jgi:hypothetical protein